MKLIRYFSAYFFKGIAVMLVFLAIYAFYHAIIILPLSTISLEIEGTDAFERQKWELYGEVFSIVIYAILAIIFAPKCFSKARKLMQKRKKSIEAKYNEPFVLYLRSFVADNQGNKVVDPLFSMGSTEEEALINVLSEVAPVFAIGNPLDKYTPFGANRVYVENNEWKNKVIEMAKFAKIVVLKLGETDNFWWEVEMCFSTIDKNKLLFIVPHSRNFSTVAILYKYLIDIGIDVEDLNVEITKTSKGNISSFIYLGADGSLFCKNMKHHKFTSWIISYENMIRNSLSSFFARYGLLYHKQLSVSKARLIQITAIIITIIFTSLYGYFGVYEMQHKTPLTNDKTIVLFVNKINSTCPTLIDSETELDKVLITRNNELQFNFTFFNWRKDSLNVHVFKKSMEESIIKQLKTNPSIKYFRENNVILSYNYKDRNGVLLTSIIISPKNTNKVKWPHYSEFTKSKTFYRKDDLIPRLYTPRRRAARRNMEAVLGFSAATKAFLKIGIEQYFHGLNMATKIRLSEKQLPVLYAKLPPICKKMGLAEPEFYLEMNPAPNAYTFGDTKIFLTITSGLVEYLDDNELEAVIAHECGHILCRHVLYHTMANMLKIGADMFGLLGVFTTPVQLALFYWSRKSELSADRAAAVITGSAHSVVETMIRLSGGPKSITGKVNIEEYAAQANAYDALQDNKWDKALQTYAVAFQDHPFSSVRTREILKWCETEQFIRLITNVNKQESGTICPHCLKPIDKEWMFCKHCGTQVINSK